MSRGERREAEPDDRGRGGRLDRAVVPTAAGLVATALVLLTVVPMPFTGDQALFSLGARALSDGKDLYTEFWDLKQPGIFLFFRASGVLPAGPEVRAHLLEVIWQLATCLLVLVALRGRIRNRFVLAAAPVLSVGWTYAVASPLVITQVEVLAGLPILAAILAGARVVEAPGSPHRGWAVAGGLALVVVAALKVMLLVIPVAAWAVMWARRPRQERRPPLGDLSLAAVASAIPAAAYLVWAWRAGALEETMRTWFEVPLGVTERAGRTSDRLVDTVSTFTRLVAPLIPLGLLGIVAAVRRPRDALLQGLATWAVLAGVVFGLQLWWLYLAFIAAVPIGALAAVGADLLVAWLAARERPRAAVVAVLAIGGLLALPAAAHLARRVERLAAADLALDPADRARFVAREDPGRADLQEVADRLDALDASDEGVVVWGNPLILFLAGRESAIAVNGWSPEHLDQRLWRRSAVELHQAAPGVVYVDDAMLPYLDDRGAAVRRVLDDHYVILEQDGGGAWYVLAGPMRHEPGEEHPSDSYGDARGRPVVSPGG